MFSTLKGLRCFLLFHLSFRVSPFKILRNSNSGTAFPTCNDEILLHTISLTSVSIIPKCSNILSKEAAKHEWLWGCCLSLPLPLPFKGRWEYAGKAIFALAASYIWPKACFRHQCLWKRCEKTSLWVQESGLFKSSWRQKKELVPVPFSILTAFRWHIGSHLYRLEYTQKHSSPSLPTVYMSQCRSFYLKRLYVI